MERVLCRTGHRGPKGKKLNIQFALYKNVGIPINVIAFSKSSALVCCRNRLGEDRSFFITWEMRVSGLRTLWKEECRGWKVILSSGRVHESWVYSADLRQIGVCPEKVSCLDLCGIQASRQSETMRR